MSMIFIELFNLAQLMLNKNRKRISPKSLPKPNFGWVLFLSHCNLGVEGWRGASWRLLDSTF